MSMNAAVRRLHVDMQHLRRATGAEKRAEASLKKAGVTEKAALADIAKQKQGVIDAFISPTQPLDAAATQKLLGQMYKLGEKEVQTTDRFDKTVAKDKQAIAHDKKVIKQDRKKALHDLRPAEFHMNLKNTNRDRHELGLHGVKKVLRDPAANGKHVTAYVNGQARTISVVPVGNGQYMRADAAKAFKSMEAAARRAGINLGANSGFRSMAEQRSLYQQYLNGTGNLAARPGYSNHQGGIAMDISGISGRGSRADNWLSNNASRFGFRNLPSEFWHYDFVG